MKNEVRNKAKEYKRWLKVHEDYNEIIVESYNDSLWLEVDDAINLAHSILEVAHKAKYKQEAGQ